MAKAKIKPATVSIEERERVSLVVASGYARAATIALAHVEHGSFRVIPDFDELCKAEACLEGALEIVAAAKDRARERL